ncbi:phage portal, lambda family protein [Escherichia coli 2788150]|nr:phage portal, lambda family protein [Escherichia coli 2788150]
MKTSTIPTLLGPDGMTSLREYAGYHGGGSGFGGQLRAWNPPSESVDAALLPNFTRGNARADDLVRNNGYAANAIQLHQDHIVGSFFRLSHRPSWRYLGIGEEEARAFSREVEAAWKEFAEDDCCCIDVERKRTFTMMIREGVAMHAFNGELFVQATWDTSPSRLFRTQFRMVSPKRISNPNNTGDSRNCRAGVQINDSGAALGYYVSEDGYEFTDTLGLVTSFSYAGDKNRQLTRYSDTRWHEDSVRNRWFSVMAGPSVRVNEWFSAYAMAGVAYSRVSTFSGDYLRVTDNKGKKHDVLTGSDDGRHSNTSLAWGAGVQFNPTESVAIDIAYEGSGSGDWRTDGFIVGVGYKF